MNPSNPADTVLPHEAIDGRTEPGLGPSDSSDSASDMPSDVNDTDSDRQNTGERAEVDIEEPADPTDIAPDEIIDEDEAGLAHSPPNPEINGG